jgi:uncharacterized coiled-coil DUF342 family protein
VLLVLASAGCAGGVKPCLVIPAQLDLANDELAAARIELDAKRRDVERWTNGIQQGHTRLQKLQEERDELRKEVDGEKSDKGTGTGGKP